MKDNYVHEQLIGWTLNNILVSNLDNHDKEYLKLYRIWKVELEKCLSEYRQEMLKEFWENLNKIKLFDTWTEMVKVQPHSDKKVYVEWYNAAVQEMNEWFKHFEQRIINNLNNIF